MTEEQLADLVEEVGRRVGYVFENHSLALKAMTHRSYFNEHPDSPGHNERLEYLGDAVLDLVIAAELMKLLPFAPEGDLTRTRAALVNEGSLAKVAIELDLGSAMRLGKGEEKNNGREKPSILSDVVEAVAGAIYLDSGYERTRDVVLAWFATPISEVVGRGAEADPKTTLQERLQAAGKEAPSYVLVGSSGPDHEKEFQVEIRIPGETLASGVGRSKKEAERNAAVSALDRPRKEGD